MPNFIFHSGSLSSPANCNDRSSSEMTNRLKMNNNGADFDFFFGQLFRVRVPPSRHLSTHFRKSQFVDHLDILNGVGLSFNPS